jgi:hypothetical protein
LKAATAVDDYQIRLERFLMPWHKFD